MIRGRAASAAVASSKYLVASSLFILLATFYFIPRVSAQYGQYGQYGAPVPSKTILIEKMVNQLGTSNFVDNLSPSDPRFAPDQQIVFRLKVKNTSDVVLNDVQVKDFVPGSLIVVSGPGTFDEATRTISFNAGDFAAGEEKEFFLNMKTASQDELPAARGMICEINKAEASAPDVFDEDSSQFCIEKQVLGAKGVPAAGPEMGLALLGLEFGLLGAGIYLKKRSR